MTSFMEEQFALAAQRIEEMFTAEDWRMLEEDLAKVSDGYREMLARLQEHDTLGFLKAMRNVPQASLGRLFTVLFRMVGALHPEAPGQLAEQLHGIVEVVRPDNKPEPGDVH